MYVSEYVHILFTTYDSTVCTMYIHSQDSDIYQFTSFFIHFPVYSFDHPTETVLQKNCVIIFQNSVINLSRRYDRRPAAPPQYDHDVGSRRRGGRLPQHADAVPGGHGGVRQRQLRHLERVRQHLRSAAEADGGEARRHAGHPARLRRPPRDRRQGTRAPPDRPPRGCRQGTRAPPAGLISQGSLSRYAGTPRPAAQRSSSRYAGTPPTIPPQST